MSDSDNLVAVLRKRERAIMELRTEASIDKVKQMSEIRRGGLKAIESMIKSAEKIAYSTMYTEGQIIDLIGEIEKARPHFVKFEVSWRGIPHRWIAARNPNFKERYERAWARLVEASEAFGEDKLEKMFGDDRLAFQDTDGEWFEADPDGNRVAHL